VAIFAALLALWRLGFNLYIARGPMRLLLAAALVVLVVQLLDKWRIADGRKAARA
jgi:hypothetical protein